MHILQYLKGTINKSICNNIRKETDSLDILIQILQMMKKTRRSTNGFIFTLSNSPIS